MREALATRDMAQVVWAYRHHPAHGGAVLTQTLVSRWLDITQAQLSRIESGRNRVRDIDKLVLYARRLRIPGEFLWFELDDSESSMVCTSQLANDTDSTSKRSLVPPSQAGAESAIADSLLMTLQQYVTTEELAGPHSVLPTALQQMTFIESLLEGSRGRNFERLTYIAARFAEFIGWLHQDTGDLRAAMRWSNTALDFAKEIHDKETSAYIQMRKSNISGDARKPELTIAFAKEALINGAALAPRLKAVILRQEAYGHALAGERESANRSLGEALTLAGDLPENEADIARYCTLSYLEMEAAHCWIELGSPEQALESIENGLSSWEPNARRDFGLCLARLSTAYASVGQSNEAVDVAKDSLSIVSVTRSHRTIRQLNQAIKHLSINNSHSHAQQIRQCLQSALR
jgi:tetratricopeptide (TPR) repeat protein